VLCVDIASITRPTSINDSTDSADHDQKEPVDYIRSRCKGLRPSNAQNAKGSIPLSERDVARLFVLYGPN
jgi:hypothetical protein